MEDTTNNSCFCEPLEALEAIAEPDFDPRTLQWVSHETFTKYNENGKVDYTTLTFYHKPDKPMYELFPWLAPGCVQIHPCDCDDCDGCDGEGAVPLVKEAEKDSFVLKLTPKGLALVAASMSGMVKDLEDTRFEAFWEKFEKMMAESGYVMEGEDGGKDR